MRGKSSVFIYGLDSMSTPMGVASCQIQRGAGKRTTVKTLGPVLACLSFETDVSALGAADVDASPLALDSSYTGWKGT